MAQSVKLSDGSYIDTEGIYDVTQGMTQKDVNSIVKDVKDRTDKLKCWSTIKSIYFGEGNGTPFMQINTSDGCVYELQIHLSSSPKLTLYKVTSTGYTKVWQIA